MPIHHIIFNGTIYEKTGTTGRKHKVLELENEGSLVKFRGDKPKKEKMGSEAKKEAAKRRMDAKWAKARSMGLKSIKGL